MKERWAGPLVSVAILGGVLLVLGFNLNLGPKSRSASSSQEVPAPVSTEPPSSAARAGQPPATPARRQGEFPIGEDVEKNQMRIAAVYLPAVQMEGMVDPASSAMIHLEADIHATEGNRNGFARDEFIPYLQVRYTIVPADRGAGSTPVIEGSMMPMVARDGLHYGANIEMPKAGRFKLTYAIEPPSKGGLGRHDDPATGVEPWWKPFAVTFDWDYPGPP